MSRCGLDLTGSVQGPMASFVNTVVNLRGSIKGGNLCSVG
jgi:hypothetical protein